MANETEKGKRKYCRIPLKAFFEYMYVVVPFFLKSNTSEYKRKKTSLKELLNISNETMCVSMSGRNIENEPNWRQYLEHIDNPFITISANELTHSLFVFPFLKNTFNELFPFKAIRTKIGHKDVTENIMDVDRALSKKQNIRDMVIEKIQYSLLQKKPISILYIKRDNDHYGECEYDILTTSLFKVRNKYYIRAYDYKSRTYKNFLISRITQCEYNETSIKQNVVEDDDETIVEIKFKINPELDNYVKYYLQNEWDMQDDELSFRTPRYLHPFIKKELTYRSEWVKASYFVEIE